MRDAWRAFLRLFFRLLYNELAWSYDLVAWLVSRGQWQAWGRTSLAYLQGKRVLELGHGPGHLLLAVAERGYSVVGLDQSTRMARQADQRLRASGLSVPLVRARAQSLPFHSRGFDTIVATFPTSYIVHPQTLHEVRRVLMAGGRLTVVLTASFDGEALIARFLSWLYRVTGQDEPRPEAFMLRLERVGLSPRIVWHQADQTAVMLVIAEKGPVGRRSN